MEDFPPSSSANLALKLPDENSFASICLAPDDLVAITRTPRDRVWSYKEYTCGERQAHCSAEEEFGSPSFRISEWSRSQRTWRDLLVQICAEGESCAEKLRSYNVLVDNAETTSPPDFGNEKPSARLREKFTDLTDTLGQIEEACGSQLADTRPMVQLAPDAGPKADYWTKQRGGRSVVAMGSSWVDPRWKTAMTKKTPYGGLAQSPERIRSWVSCNSQSRRSLVPRTLSLYVDSNDRKIVGPVNSLA
jgi:hypothetical protein